jgi:hypothetical protein
MHWLKINYFFCACEWPRLGVHKDHNSPNMFDTSPGKLTIITDLPDRDEI